MGNYNCFLRIFHRIGYLNSDYFARTWLSDLRCKIEFKFWFRLTLIKENGINEITISY